MLQLNKYTTSMSLSRKISLRNSACMPLVKRFFSIFAAPKIGAYIASTRVTFATFCTSSCITIYQFFDKKKPKSTFLCSKRKKPKLNKTQDTDVMLLTTVLDAIDPIPAFSLITNFCRETWKRARAADAIVSSGFIQMEYACWNAK